MPIKKFTADGTWNTGVPGQCDASYRVAKYSGSLGGGTLSIHSLSQDLDPDTVATIETPVPDAELTVAKVDGNGDVIKQLVVRTSGSIVVKLTGATAPAVTVMVE